MGGLKMIKRPSISGGGSDEVKGKQDAPAKGLSRENLMTGWMAEKEGGSGEKSEYRRH
jgi:hypothetical protein